MMQGPINDIYGGNYRVVTLCILKRCRVRL